MTARKPPVSPLDGRHSRGKRVLWRCPTCGMQDVYERGETLPGGPALCEHPSSSYEMWPTPDFAVGKFLPLDRA